MIYGYARISTIDQNEGMRIAALKKARCQKIFTDKKTGETTARGVTPIYKLVVS
jgi:DNA invertase Pin-like site-specific DNA recombinase